MFIFLKRLTPILFILLFPTITHGASFTEVIDPDGGEKLYVTFISENGNGVAGYSDVGTFFWRSGVIFQLPGIYQGGGALSSDGSTLVGRTPFSRFISCVITKASGTTSFGAQGLLANLTSYCGASGASADGNVVVGISSTGTSPAYEPFIWTKAGGIKPLINHTNLTFNTGRVVISADGTVVAGAFSTLFRYIVSDASTGAGTYTPLGNLAAKGLDRSTVNSISADGSSIVGYSYNSSTSDERREAFRIVNTDAMEGLGDLPGGADYSLAYATSVDGSIVVGLGTTDTGQEAFIWDDSTYTMRRLADVLAVLGLDLSGWMLTDARDISDDGSKIIGRGTKDGVETSWIAEIGTNWMAEICSSSSAASLTGKFGRTDFNNDGKDDILWRNTATGENALYLMDGVNIDAVRSINTLACSDWRVVGVGDFDGDNKHDILWRNQATGENSLYLMDDSNIASGSSILRVADTNWDVAGIGDFNNDGYSDIFWFNKVTGETYLFLMNGATISAQAQSITVPSNWRVAGMGDFDSDGNSDILWRNSSTGENYILLMNGLEIASHGSIITVADLNWEIAGVGDFDNDSKSDVFWRNSVSGEVYVFLMDGIGVKDRKPLVTVGDLNWKIEHIGDFNGDGYVDTFWRNSATGQNWMLLLDGIGIDLSQEISTVQDLNWKVNGD